MSDTSDIILLWIIALLLVGTVLWIVSHFDFPRPCARPIVCVCEVKIDDVVGVILQKDFHKAARLYWHQYLSGEIKYSLEDTLGHRVRISHTRVFVFMKDSAEFRQLTENCFLEQATFDVPWRDVLGQKVPPLQEAWQYIYGKPMQVDVTA